MKKLVLIALLMLSISSEIFAGDGSPAGESLFRQSGKIYVVVAIIAVIFAGIVAYLVYLDRKLKEMEKDKRS